MSATRREINVAGPYYEELSIGDVFDGSPGLTLTEGHAALHQSILGDRLRLPLDRHLAEAVTGDPRPLAHPGLVTDIAIGQSTLATQRVIANLFYRGLVLRRSPRIGDTLRTSTEVVALRDTRAIAGRAPTGLAALHIRTVDQDRNAVLDFHRCAMLPISSEEARPGHADDLAAISAELDPAGLTKAVEGWDLDAFKTLVPGDQPLEAATTFVVESGDTVSCAPELVRMSLNVAAAHSDPGSTPSGRRLVYGGHTIGLALSHVTRALPNLVTVVAWRSCDHLAPVFEGDVLHSTIEVEATAPNLIDLRVRTSSDRGGIAPGAPEGADAAGRFPVLDWRLIGVIA